MALLSSQTQNYNISNIGKIGHLSEAKIVLFVTRIAYYAKQNIWTYCLGLWKAYICVPWWKDIGQVVHDTTSFQTENYHFSNIDQIGHLSEVKIVLFVVSIA